ncbi:hypothetical protein J4217_00815 [Candidatus Pacearchaeota archaeon]|nr:hypothetical protein [Candidatus Pacearchaeota archaeon]
MADKLIKRKLKFGKEYKIVSLGLRYDRIYLARVEGAEGEYHCFAGITDREHKLPRIHNSKIVPDEYERFPDRVMIEAIKEGDFMIKGLEIVVKSKARTILVGFEHLSCGVTSPMGANAEMCLRLMKILKKDK